MGSIDRLAGAAGSIGITTKTTAGQLITPVSVPVVRWYTDAARTLNEVTLAVTGAGSSYTATYTAAQAPAAAAKRYLKVTIEVSAGVFDTDADDEVNFVDASASIENRYLTVAQVRDHPNLRDPAKFPDAKIIETVDWFETTFEDYTQVAWLPRTTTVTLDVQSDGTIMLPHYHPRSITAVRTFTGPTTFTDFTADELAGLIIEASGRVRRWSGVFTRGARVQFTYEHGAPTLPADVVRAAKIAVQGELLKDRSGRLPYSVMIEGQVQWFSRPGPNHPFGNDDVDEVANRRAMVSGGGSVVVG